MMMCFREFEVCYRCRKTRTLLEITRDGQVKRYCEGCINMALIMTTENPFTNDEENAMYKED